MERVSKINYYLDIAQTVSERSTCLRKRFGAIIVKNDSIVSTGYNGARADAKIAAICASASESISESRAANGTRCAAASTPKQTRSSQPHAKT